MTKTILWSSSAGDIPADLAFKNNFAASAAPTVNDDVSEGYSAGSTWIYDGAVYTCADAAVGAAVWIIGATKSSSGDISIGGNLYVAGQFVKTQGDPAAKTVSATLTAAEVLAGIITVDQGAGSTAALQFPTGSDMAAGLPADFGVDDSFDISVINASTVDAEDATVTVNTGFTIVGSADIPAHSGATLSSSGMFRVRKTAANTFVAYRIA